VLHRVIQLGHCDLSTREDAMPANREMTMRQMRQVLRLHASKTSDREIGRVVGAARSTVRDAIQRAKAAGLAWPLPEDLTDTALEEKLFARAGARIGTRRRPEPDWAHLVQEFKRPGVSIAILHEEYLADHASASRGWRQGVRRLFRQEAADRRSAYR
jgi:hypothetical protein